MKATAIAPANIAFVKYWGKTEDELRLPANASISMNLSGAYTTTTVEFSDTYDEDTISLLSGEFSEKELGRIAKHLDRIRRIKNIKIRAKVMTKNSFPKGAGAASSASGFAALAVAAACALALKLSEKELTVLARIGSGSACRSIPDGFVEWKQGDTSDSSYAVSLYPASYWDLRDVLVIVDSSAKKVSTTEGMDKAQTSPFYNARIGQVSTTNALVKEALARKDFARLGNLIEMEAINMHAVMMTQCPPLFYWNSVTLDIVQSVQKWRQEGIEAYFTIDAGPNVHLICETRAEKALMKKLETMSDIQNIIVNKPSPGTKLVESHLF